MKVGIKNILGRGGRFTWTTGIALASLLGLFGCGSGSDPNNVKGQSSTPQALLFVSDGPEYDFGLQAVQSATDHTFIVSNIGPAAATLITGSFAVSAFSFKDGSFPGTGGTCTASLASQGSCTIVVTFSPGYTGDFNDIVRLSYESAPGTFTYTTSPAIEGECGNVGN